MPRPYIQAPFPSSYEERNKLWMRTVDGKSNQSMITETYKTIVPGENYISFHGCLFRLYTYYVFPVSDHHKNKHSHVSVLENLRSFIHYVTISCRLCKLCKWRQLSFSECLVIVWHQSVLFTYIRVISLEIQSQNTLSSLHMMVHSNDYGLNERESTKTIHSTPINTQTNKTGEYCRTVLLETGIRVRDKSLHLIESVVC